ncbi:MAG TPA: TspO/MBR family protein [bacterium]|nr:TspO/MBR family protein [bacterium]
MSRAATSRDWLVLAGFIALCLGAGAVGSWFTMPALDVWYAALRKPSWNPPNWVFAPVWTALYLTMAVAAWMVWRRAGVGAARTALILFAVQLILNVAWSALFFALRSPALGVAGIVALWAALVATIVSFGRISAGAAWLMIPYLVWVTFAGALNVAVWRLNA